MSMVFCVLFGSSCSGDGSSGPSDASGPTCTICKTFVTSAEFTGDIRTAGGQLTAIASADALCMVDMNKPAGTSVYKALLVDGTNRVAVPRHSARAGPANIQIGSSGRYDILSKQRDNGRSYDQCKRHLDFWITRHRQSVAQLIRYCRHSVLGQGWTLLGYP